jgi:hypothetical protein
MLQWLRANKFRSHLIAFLLMIISAALLYPAAHNGATSLIWALLGVFICGNLVALATK